jgi:membrane associated rhomboid family serine protease
MNEYRTISYILILGGIAVLLFSLQSKLVGPGNGISGWIQIGGACIGIVLIIIGSYFLFRAKKKSK